LTLRNEKMKFKEFILNEQKAYLSQSIGDILSVAHDLRDDSGNMGSRDLSRRSEKIVNQIRRILHSNWSKENIKHLKPLQKVGVALMKSVKEKGDLQGTISGVVDSLEKLVQDMGTVVNKIGTDSSKIEDDEKNNTNIEMPIKDQTKAPPKPKTIEKAVNVGSPTSEDPEILDNPSLGGNSGPLSAI